MKNEPAFPDFEITVSSRFAEASEARSRAGNEAEESRRAPGPGPFGAWALLLAGARRPSRAGDEREEE